MNLRYVYGIVPSAAATRVATEHLVGIDDEPVRTIDSGAFSAAVSDVDGSVYDSDALNERVRDLEWLTPRAAAHQQVNARLLEVADVVLPLTFGALYRDDERVRAMLREDEATRRARLDELAGKGEWVVTITREPNTTPGAGDDLRELDRDIASSTPGRAYLLERRRTTVASAATERADRDVAERALGALAAIAERTYREPVAKGGGDVVVVRVSLLAPRRDADRVAARIAQFESDIEGDGYRVRTTGPWPAYRFGSL